VAAPLWLLRTSDIAFQLYFGRLVSLSLYLVVLVAAFSISKELTSPANPLRWMVPLSLALLPGFNDLMTAVNDDAGATAFYSLYLWAGIVIISRGLTWQRFGALLITAALCLVTKNTAAMAAAITTGLLAILLIIKRRTPFIWLVPAVIGLLLTIGAFRWGDAADWIRETSQRPLTRTASENAPVGKYVFQLMSDSNLLQIPPAADFRNLRGKIVTIGGWIWAGSDAKARTVNLVVDGQPNFQEVSITSVPAFFSQKLTVPTEAQQIVIRLDTENTAAGGATIYYDGLVLVEGDFSQQGAPEYTEKQGVNVLWGGQIHINAIRNASAERAWPGIRPQIDRYLAMGMPSLPSTNLGYLLDWKTTGWYYRSALGYILQTFWGKFGWGHVELIGARTYLMLVIISLIGIAGAACALVARWRAYPIYALIFLGMALLVVFSLTLLRGLSSITNQLFIPPARYTYPVIIPVALMLNAGWLWFTGFFGRRRYPKLFGGLYLGFFICLDALSVASILRYYY
jgi:hypothetical protein